MSPVIAAGLHASALTTGGALAMSLTGLMIDNWSPNAAVLAVGGAGIAAAVVAALLARGSPPVKPRPQLALNPARADSAAMNVLSPEATSQ